MHVEQRPFLQKRRWLLGGSERPREKDYGGIAAFRAEEFRGPKIKSTR